jgi:hypothetical protein
MVQAIRTTSGTILMELNDAEARNVYDTCLMTAYRMEHNPIVQAKINERRKAKADSLHAVANALFELDSEE